MLYIDNTKPLDNEYKICVLFSVLFFFLVCSCHWHHHFVFYKPFYRQKSSVFSDRLVFMLQKSQLFATFKPQKSMEIGKKLYF